MLAMAVTRPTTKRRIPKTFIACLLGGWCKTYSLGGALRPFDGVYEISDPLQFLQYSTAHRYDLARCFRLNDRALPWQHSCTEANSMRHSEPSPAIHNVEMPGLTPSLDHVESDPNRRSVALPLLLPGTFVILHTRNTCYRLVVIDGAERRVQINGGKLFPENTDVEVIGAIDD